MCVCMCDFFIYYIHNYSLFYLLTYIDIIIFNLMYSTTAWYITLKRTVYDIIIILFIAYNPRQSERRRTVRDYCERAPGRDTSPTRQSNQRRRTTRSTRPVRGGRLTRLLACARTLSSGVRAASHIVAGPTSFPLFLPCNIMYTNYIEILTLHILCIIYKT